MKSLTKLFYLGIIFIFISCSPATKQDYLAEYSEFIETIEDRTKEKKKVDWEQQDKKFTYYSKEMYEKFKEEMSIMDEVKVNAYRVRYNVHRHKSNILDGLINDKELAKIRKDLQEYVENDMEKDVAEIIKEAEKVSEEFGNAVREIADEIQAEVEAMEK